MLYHNLYLQFIHLYLPPPHPPQNKLVTTSLFFINQCLILFCIQVCLFAAAAKSLQSCPTLWDPIDGSPSGSAVPLQPTRLRPFFPPGNNTGVGCHFLLQSTDMNLSKFWEMVKNKEVWHAAVLGVAKSQTQLSN